MKVKSGILSVRVGRIVKDVILMVASFFHLY